VIRQEDRGEAELAAVAGHLGGWHPTVKRGGAVQVEVDPNLGNFTPRLPNISLPPCGGGSGWGMGATCASGHVRYYRPGEGSGKGLHQ
jgi:hypothetical protein